MDIETLIGALNADERAELLEQLSASAQTSDTTTEHAHDGEGCCGGGRRHMARRREMMAEMRQMCCGSG